jgi:hypothetical protein
MNKKVTIILALLINLILPSKVYAYIDPGSSSIILQAIVAAIVGAWTAITIYWQKLKIFFLKIFKKKREKKN